MHWGHAVSKDMIRWEHLPIALYPDSLGYIFSGSAVADVRNTSGLGTAENPPLIAIFTYHDPEGEKAGRIDYQTQGIAFSLDKGRTWAKYAGNPVIPNPGIRDFRDPKVFWHDATQRWVLILAAADRVQLYRSPNLINWEYLSEFGANSGSHGGVWECPDLFELPVQGTVGKKAWVLLLSINPGGPNGGSATQYFIGDFDGKIFRNTNPEPTTLWVDWGKDNYAGVTWANIPETDGRRLFLGWMSNWQYANVVPTDTWRSAMTVPRELQLTQTAQGIRLVSVPVAELQTLRQSETAWEASAVDGEWNLSQTTGFQSATWEGSFDFQLADGTTEVGVILANAKGEQVVVGYDRATNAYFVDRSRAGEVGFSEAFPGKHPAPSINTKNEVSFHIFADVASVEVFAEGGLTALTEIFFPNEPMQLVKCYSKGAPAQLAAGKVFSLAR